MKLVRWYRSGERGSVTLTWESAAATVLVLVGFGGVKYLTTTADCAQQEATDWVACSNVLDASCENTIPNCKVAQTPVPDPEPDPCPARSRKSSYKTDNRMVAPNTPAKPSNDPQEPVDPDASDPVAAPDPCV